MLVPNAAELLPFPRAALSKPRASEIFEEKKIVPCGVNVMNESALPAVVPGCGEKRKSGKACRSSPVELLRIPAARCWRVPHKYGSGQRIKLARKCASSDERREDGSQKFPRRHRLFLKYSLCSTPKEDLRTERKKETGEMIGTCNRHTIGVRDYQIGIGKQTP